MKEKKALESEVKKQMVKTVRWSIDYHTRELAKFKIQLELLTNSKEDEDTHS